jgi:hypothetical protein
LTGFSTTAAVNCDALAAAANSTAGFPRYLWAMFKNTDPSTFGMAIFFGPTTVTNEDWYLSVNHSGYTGELAVTLATETDGAYLFGGTPDDGSPHVCCLSSASTTSHTMYIDGTAITTSGSSAAGTMTFGRLTIGANRSYSGPTQSAPFLGTIIAAGWGLGNISSSIASFSAHLLAGTWDGVSAGGSPGAGASLLMGGF